MYSSSKQRRLVQSTFNQLKINILNNLYGGGNASGDKSPKGSLDEPIKELVYLINQNPNYVTLSSCSGRIALFDPCAKIGTAVRCDYTSKAALKQSINRKKTGKGGGTWLLSSHAPVRFLDVAKALYNSEDNSNYEEEVEATETPLIFKHEPFLMHIACATLKAAQVLLHIALSNGYRESGIIFTNPTRITVAIRTQGLALQVPLSRSGNLRPSTQYLEGLVQEANVKLEANLQKLAVLQEALGEGFNKLNVHKNELKNSCMGTSTRTKASTNNQIAAQTNWGVELKKHLPDLKLWDHAAVVVHRKSSDSNLVEDEDTHILVFGGYGIGPSLKTANTSIAEGKEKTRQTSSPRRVNTVFRLVRRSSTGEWNHHWEQLYPLPSSWSNKGNSGSPREASASSDSDTTGILFTPRQGHAACYTNTSLSSVCHSVASVFVFGGRTSPTNALDDLFIYHYSHINANSRQHQSQSYCSFRLLNNAVKGSPPKPRWGHTFTSLSNDIDNIGNNYHSSERHLAVLVGGRDHTNAFSDVFVLSELPKQSPNDGYFGDNDVIDSCHLQWSKLADLEIPRFHHTTALISYPMLYDDVGKTKNTDACINDKRLLAVYGGLSNTTNLLDCFNMQQKRRTMEVVSFSGNTENHTTEGSKSKQPVLDDIFFFTPLVGAAACSWGNLVLLSGGVSCCGDDATGNPFSLMSLNHHNENSGNSGIVSTHRLFSYTPQKDKSDNFVLNVGSMVHHCAISLNRNRSIEKLTKEPDEIKAATSIDKEFLLLGGGVPMFAFGPSYGRLVFLM